MTREQLIKLYPRASADFIRRNADPDAHRLPSVREERAKGGALVSAPSGKTKSVPRVVQRAHITFRVFAVRPMDWDNPSTKELQDLLVTAGIMPGDAWHQLYGTVISEKVSTTAEEKTVIEITPWQNE